MDFDYVIAGGGSAGCTLAARLSEDPSKTVCLIEAGGEGKNLLIRAPAGVIALLPGRPKINNWAFETVPQQSLGGRKGYQPRGKTLGGSSAINAMLYIRGHRSDYDEWADLGCDGWSWDEVLPYFRRAEGNERGTDALHGGDGPLRVAEQQEPRALSRAFVEACGENQIRRNDDFNGPEQEGAGLYQVTQFWGEGRNGERCSAAAAYLHPAMDRPNLTVITGAHATGIVLDGKRATGVRYRVGKATPLRKPGARSLSAVVPSVRRNFCYCPGSGRLPNLPCTALRLHMNCPASARTCRIISISSWAGDRRMPT